MAVIGLDISTTVLSMIGMNPERHPVVQLGEKFQDP